VVPRIFEQLRLAFPEAGYLLFLTVSLDILNEISDYRKILIIDTVKLKKGIPGKVKTCSFPDYEPTLHLENAHDISLPRLTNFAKKLNIPLTNDIQIISIEISDHTTISSHMSPPVSANYLSILDQVRLAVQSCIFKTSLMILLHISNLILPLIFFLRKN